MKNAGNTSLVTRHLSLAAAVALATITAHAGVKYWDNPDFRDYDVGDYVQDGLVLHYDGIRNQGPDAEHADSPTLWQNCASDGAWPMHWCSYVPTGSGSYRQWTKDNTTQGKWTTNGFAFDGYSYFAKWNEGSAFSIPSVYTIQFVAEASIGNLKGNVGYLWQPATGWDQGGVGMRKNDGGSAATGRAYSCYMVDKTVNSGARSNFYPADHNLSYANFTVDYATTHKIRAFEGPLPTTDASANVTMNASPARSVNWFVVGGFHNKGTTVTDFECFVGTMHGVRFYTKVLSDEELLWNRVVDEARFFNRRAAIPVTNVVVSTTIPGVDGYQPCGAYAIDEDGFTFTAPAQRTIKGMRYVLNGYQLETWNGLDWGTPVAYNVESSYAATDTTALVRLTWQYERPAGEGRLVVYDESDYVTDGLELFLDGIRNAGLNADHDSTATTWINLGPSGSTGNGVLTKGSNGDQGHWTDDGYSFAGLSKYVANLTYTKTYTIQILTDMVQNNQYDPTSTTIYLFSGSQARFALATYNQYVYLRTQNKNNDTNLRFTIDKSKPIGYITAMQENDEKWAAVFPGTEVSSQRHYDGDMDDLSVSNLAIGGWGGGTGQYMKGTIQSFRYYTNILTQAQLEQNRKVDNYRFFGIVPQTNVFVQSTYSYLEGYDKCGPYDVDGSYTFTAPASVTANNGITYDCDGYTVETLDANGLWGSPVSSESCFYRYETNDGTVRLTWRWKPVSGLRTAADYTFDDYSSAGLRLHYDGLLNAGVDAARNKTATKWVNLGSDGAAMDLSISSASGATADQIGAWTEDDGYNFGGYSQFQTSYASSPTDVRPLWGDTFTAQSLSDVGVAANVADNIDRNLFATSWDRMGVRLCNGDSWVRFDIQALDYANRPRFKPASSLTWLTVMEDASARTAAVFEGTTVPTTVGAANGLISLTSIAAPYRNNFRLGGWGGGPGGNQNIIGTIKNFRYYDRVLTEEELVRNRNVDAVRYFGELGVTNLVVEVEAGSNIDADPAAGAYYVEGSYDFSATRNGGTTALGYKIQEWDEANSTWVTTYAAEDASFSYSTTSATAPKMRLLWCEVKPFILIVR